MRNHVIDRITEMAAENDRIMLLCADLGYNVVNNYMEKYPDRFLNVGIAEQNMASVAAGLAIEGNIVFTYSIGNFPTLRCMEQIRNDICYHNADVKILAVGGGFAYGDLGMSHHATEDIAMMKALPNMRVYVPADEVEAVACLEEAVSIKGPAYIRMARGKELRQHSADAQLCISKLIPIINKEKADICILATGTVLSESVKLSVMLEEYDINASVFSVPSVKPLDEEGVGCLAAKYDFFVSMEDHNVIGGFGESIAGILTKMPFHVQLLKIGLNDTFTEIVGSQDYLRKYYGISADKVKERILKVIKV